MPLQFPVPRAEAVVAGLAIVLLYQMIPPFGSRLAKQGIHHLKAVREGVRGKGEPGKGREAGGEIDSADGLLRDPGWNASLPMRDERGAGAAFMDAVFPAPPRTGGAMIAPLFQGLILVPVVHHRPIVGTENKEGVFRKTEALHRLHELADAPIQLHNGVAPEAEGGDSLEPLVGDAGHVEIMRGEKEEERFAADGFDPLNRFLHPLVRQILVPETRRVPPGVKANPADAVMDGAIVPFGPVHFQRLPMRDAGRMIRNRFLRPDPERVLGIKVQDAAVLHINLRHPVIGGGQEEMIIEAQLLRAGGEVTIPIRPPCPAEAEVPFADYCGLVTRLLHQIRQGEGLVRDDEGAVGRRDTGAGMAEGITAGEQGITRRRAGGS